MGAALGANMVSASGGLLGGGGDGVLGGGSGGGGLLDGGGGGGGLLDGGGGGGGGGGLLDGGGGGGGLLGGGGGGGLLGGGGGGGGGDVVPPPPSTTPAPTPTDPTDPTGSGGSGSSSYGPGGSAAPSNAGGRGSSGAGHGRGEQGSAAGGPAGPHPPPPVRSNGVPTPSNPTTTIAPFGPAPLGVPNFVIDQFEIPPFLLPIYQACGTQYGIPWPVLAGINKIETAFGTNVNVSSAGAVGWMQFMPDTWRTWGVDATGDRKADPYNPVDAICSAARYLKASGGQTDPRGAIFAYNHADWYVDEVLLYAKQYGNLPQDLVSSLTGLTSGDRFPVAANARYADSPRKGATDTRQRATDIYSRAGAPVIAVNDGTIKRIGDSERLGNFLVLEDTYGNRFIYSQLGKIEKVHPVAKKRSGGKPAKAAGREASAKGVFQHMRHQLTRIAGPAQDRGPVNTEDTGRRLFAFPHRKLNAEAAAAMGQLTGPISAPSYSPPASSGDAIVRFRPRTMELRPLRKGSQVSAGTLLGRVGRTDPELAPHLSFGIRPAGRRSPRIDPKPILDGWKLLEATAIYRAAGQNPFQQSGPTNVSQDLLMPKAALEKRVLTDPRLEIYACGRNDVATGQIDQRVLAAMEYLADRGYRLTITSLKCGHSFLASSGNVSEHSTGDAMDIAAVNGIPIAGHQGPGSITAAVINDLLQLQGPMQPHQIISLMNMGGPSFAMADHWDHIHVGYYPHGTASPARSGADLASLVRLRQWLKLVGRLTQIRNPEVPTTPSTASLWVRLQERQGPKQAPSGE